jgi:F-type H+-transporting ATPase subunit b
MGINWFTVIAQIVNFLVLIWLLKRFLYKPVLNAIRQREIKIAAQLEEAQATKAEAEKERNLFLQKNKSFDKERAAKMDNVREKANSEKQRLFKDVRNEANSLRLKYEESLKQQEREMTDTIKQKTKNEVFAIAAKTLADLADVSLEEQAVNILIQKFRGLDAESKAKLKKALEKNGRTITITTAFELSSPARSDLENALSEISEQQRSFEYRLEPELVTGIEVNVESYQLSWNIESYLNTLHKNSASTEKENTTG